MPRSTDAVATLEHLAQALAEVRHQLDQERAARLAAERQAAGAGGAGGAAGAAQRGGRIDGGNEQHIDPRVLNKCPAFSGYDKHLQELSFIFESA